MSGEGEAIHNRFLQSYFSYRRIAKLSGLGAEILDSVPRLPEGSKSIPCPMSGRDTNYCHMNGQSLMTIDDLGALCSIFGEPPNFQRRSAPAREERLLHRKLLQSSP